MGCTSATPATLPVIIKETPAILPVSSNSPLCSGDTLKLTSSLVAGASYNWTGPNGFTSTLQNPIIPRAQVTATGIYSVTASMAGCTSAAATTPVTVNPTPAVDAGPDRIIFLNQVITLNPVITGTNLQYLWTPNLYLSSNTVRNPTATGVEDILYRLNVTSAFGCKNSDSIFIKVLKPFVIPNTFTPNNDGIHDYWVIPNLPGYPDALVQVFTRTGQKVFEQRGYYKPWDGNMNGKSLPFDTYYYIVEAGNGLRPQTGYVTIVK